MMRYEEAREQQLYREIVAILMGSRFYFDLSLEDRYRLVKHILDSSSLSSPEKHRSCGRQRELSH